MKHSFFDSRPESAHPEVIDYLFKHNFNQFVDPAKDPQTNLGIRRIKEMFGMPEAEVYYFPNGTITNVTALSVMLKPFEAVICPSTGHINTYEAGAFEATGHKIVSVSTPDGKLTPERIEPVLEQHSDPFMVMPKALYLTQITEEGTVYTKKELEALITYARRKDLYVYVDGARLAMAIASKTANITIKEFGMLDLDMFYIGGGKDGALYGEALVIKNDTFKSNLFAYMKRQGAAMGKLRPLDLQFARLFAGDNLWLKLAEHANAMGERLREGLARLSSDMMLSGDANHAFISIDNTIIEALEKDFEFARWQKVDEKRSKIRLVCSWATQPKDVDEFLRAIKSLV